MNGWRILLAQEEKMDPQDQDVPLALPADDAADPVLFELTASLWRLHYALQLVGDPYSLVHEFKRQITFAPPEPITVRVTPKLLRIGETAYVASHLVSVTTRKKAKNIGCALALVGLGGVMLMCGVFNVMASAVMNPFGGDTNSGMGIGCGFGLAVLLILGGISVFRSAKDQSVVEISLSSGETDGLMSTDADVIRRIHAALYTVISQGGEQRDSAAQGGEERAGSSDVA
jgi:hypothetical protein